MNHELLLHLLKKINDHFKATIGGSRAEYHQTLRELKEAVIYIQTELDENKGDSDGNDNNTIKTG